MYRLLIIIDVERKTKSGTIGWAYQKRAIALRKYAPRDFHVEYITMERYRPNMGTFFDVVFNLDYMSCKGAETRAFCKNTVFVTSYNSDSNRRRDIWPAVRNDSYFIVVNNRNMWDWIPDKRGCYQISNGVDTEIYRKTVPIEKRPHKVIWCGSSSPKKGKGYEDILVPAQRLLEKRGFECDFRPINHIKTEFVKNDQSQVEWYNSASYVVCASNTEGTPNYLLEAMACGCVPISTRVGNILEFKSPCGVLCDRSTPSIVAGVEAARSDRETLSRRSEELIRDQWSYGHPGNRAMYYFSLFRKLVTDKPPAPFSYMDVDYDGF